MRHYNFSIKCRSALSFILLSAVATFFSAFANGSQENEPQLPEISAHIHMGVASCATSACHGKIAAVVERNVMLNEYHLWSTQDHHSRAYQTLLSDQSKKIANYLNLPSAHTAQECLACHADNVPAERRGPKFQLSDGVGCEACHGGSENWLKKHTEPDATHASNIAAGLYPTENPYPRAALCLSCHIGTKSKFADHEMMAAGHPRLTFELDTFTANQPAHYQIDDDYIQRKGQPSVGYLWMVGQVESAKRLLTLVDTHGGKFTSKSLAVYDCHSCHRPMKVRTTNSADIASTSLPVGSPRLLDYPLDMLAVMFGVLLPVEQPAWKNAIADLQQASGTPANLPAATNALRTSLTSLEKTLTATPPPTEKVKAVRVQIAEQGAAGKFDDFTSAEQAFLAIESLSYSIGDRDNLASGLDEVYKSVDNEFLFDPAKFRQALTNFKKNL